MEFTPTTADGTVEMSFTIDTTSLNGKSLVAFETLKDKETGKVIAEHKDINDQGQTVVVKDKPDVPTGVTRTAWIFAILTMLSLAGLAFYEGKRIRKVRDDK